MLWLFRLAQVLINIAYGGLLNDRLFQPAISPDARANFLYPSESIHSASVTSIYMSAHFGKDEIWQMKCVNSAMTVFVRRILRAL